MINRLALGIVAILGWFEPSFANTAYVYTQSQNDIYEIVIENPTDKSSELAPGIYRIDKKTGESVLLISGKVTGANRSYKGILAYLARSGGADSTHDALSLVDGRLVILNHNTSPRSQNSSIVLGGRKSPLDVRDVIHGTSVEIPTIASIEDVKVLEGPRLGLTPDLPKGGRLVLLSIKAPNPFGSGMTIALVVEGGTAQDHKVKVLHNSAWVIGYEFMAEDALERLLPSGALKSQSDFSEISIYSPSMLTKFKNQLSKGGGPIARAWMDQISRFQKYVHSGLAGEGGDKATVALITQGIPTYGILSRKEKLEQTPVETVFQDGSRFIGQTFDPANGQYRIINQANQNLAAVKVGRKELLFGPSAVLETMGGAQLKLDRDGDSGKYFLIAEGEQENEADVAGEKTPVANAGQGQEAYLFFSGEKPYYMARASNGQIQWLQLPMEFKSADKIQFVSRRMTVDGKIYTVLFVYRKPARAEKVTVEVLVLTEGHNLSLVNSAQIMNAAGLSFKEFTFRIAEDEGLLLFDNVSPVKGAAAYLKIKEGEENTFLESPNIKVPLKTVPYFHVSPGVMGQKYLTTLSESVMVQSWLTWRSYNPLGATESATGFYLEPKVDKKKKEGFIAGYPLYSRTEPGGQKIHVMQSKVVQSAANSTLRIPPILISTFPYVDKTAKKVTDEKDIPTIKELVETNKFHLGMLFNPETGDKVDGVLRAVEVPLPFKSLAYTQILQGYKNRADEFYVLLFFKQDPKVANSINGVYVVSGTYKWTGSGMEIAVNPLTKVHKDFVPPGTTKAHLLLDAEGSFYWVSDPEKYKEGTGKVFKLAQMGEAHASHVGQVQQLREPDHLKETDVGFVSSSLRMGGRWEILSSYGLKGVVPKLNDLIEQQNSRRQGKPKKEVPEKDKEKDKDAQAEEDLLEDPKGDKAEAYMFEAFNNFLDTLVNHEAPEQRHPRIIVVDESLKEKFKMRMFMRLAEQDTPISLSGPKMVYYHANAALDDVEISEELRYIIDQPRDRKGLLYVDSALLKELKIPVRAGQGDSDEDGEAPARLDHEADPKKSPFPPSEAADEANLPVLLATDGGAKSIKGFRRVGRKGSKLPMVSIVTPEEWREIQDLHYDEVSNGVFDGFEVNNDFLTSGWTVWAPKNNRAAPDMKELLKIPYRHEEMRVFPSLDKILNEAATGQLKGKQKILIVPAELKALVQKLILLRWSTSEATAGNWSHRNRKFAFHRIMGTDNGQQSVIQDNFAAMRGVANFRNSVLYSDLDTILRIGRPAADKGRSSFRLKDPLKATGGYLIDAAQAQTDLEKQAAAQAAAKAAEEPVDPEELEEEIGSLSQEINTIRDRINSLERAKRSPGVDAAVEKELDNKINRQRAELKLLQDTRARFEDKLPDEGATANNGEQKRVKSANDATAYPHLLWWIATEGQAIQPQKSAGWKIRDSVDLSVSTILVGTEEELGMLRTDMAFEGKFFDLDKHFDIQRLEAPTDETKYNLVQQLFERPEVTALGISFKLKSDNGREPRSQLIHHFINRIDQLAYDQRLERTAAFIRAYVALKNSLTEDLDLRRNRQISERFIERLFTKVFPMPLNPEILEPNDPLNRLRNVDQAVRDMQEAGYEGSPDLKRRVFENSLSQTRPTDSSKPIPDSQILHGSTSTGKTFLLKTLFKMLNLVEYNRNKPNNEDADYIFINVAKLTDAPTKEPDKMAVDDAIEDIHDLMSQPNGARAKIVIDDAHKASGKGVREKLHQFIQGLFESPNGMFTVRSKDGKRHREVPVQNLGLYMTVNPTANEGVRRQFVKDTHTGSELLKREVLAALSGDGFTPEESYLARWSDIINLDNFPRSAKVPGLVKRVRQNAGRSGQMVLVDSRVIDTLIDRFPQAHARELLAPATAALTMLPSTAEKAPMYLVSVRRDAEQPRKGEGVQQGGVSQQDLQGTVRSFAQVDAIKLDDPHGLYHLMGFVMRNFRLQVFNFMALEAHMSDTLRMNVPGQANVLKTNFLLGVSTHVLDNPILPSGEMTLKPEHFAGVFNHSNMQEIMRYQTSLKEKEKYFPINLETQDRASGLDITNFVQGMLGQGAQSKTRRDVLIDTVNRLETLMMRAMQVYLRVDSVEALKEIGGWNEQQLTNWFQKLPEKDQDEAFKKFGQELLSLYFEFMDRMHSPDLVSSSTNDVKISLNLYDQVRLFSFALDKAVTRMPWGQIAQFTLKVANLSTDFSLGTRPSFREYVGVHQLSPFTIATPEFINEMLTTTVTGHGRNLAEKLPQFKEQFYKNCELLLGNGKEEARK
jgi:hypothetical protein